MDTPGSEHLARLRSVLGAPRPIAFRRPSGGYTPAERWVVELDDGTSCFVKTGEGRWAERLRVEHKMYVSLAGQPFLPHLLAWDDDGAHPVLVTEDLSAAAWPPPWTNARIESVPRTLEQLRSALPWAQRIIRPPTLDGLDAP